MCVRVSGIRTLASVDEFGVSTSSVQDYVLRLSGDVAQAVGPTVDLSPESRQGQLIGVLAASLAQIDRGISQLYQSTSIRTASGNGLDAQTALLGIIRRPASRSRATVTFEGVLGQDIPQGTRLRSTAGDIFTTDAEAVILQGGTTTADVTAVDVGPVGVGASSITEFVSAVSGLSSVNNFAAGVEGRDIESDVELRNRYYHSLAGNSLGSLGALESALLSVPGVTHVLTRDNATATAATVGGLSIPAYSLMCVVEGGTDAEVAAAVSERKPAGIGTAGTTLVSVPTVGGFSVDVRFQRMVVINLRVAVTISATSDFPANGASRIGAATVSYLSALLPGEVPDDQRVRAAMLTSAPGFTIDSLSYTDAASMNAIGASINLDRRLAPSLDRVDVTVS